MAKTLRLEAEDLRVSYGFLESGRSSFASDDGFIFTRPGKWGEASSAFDGPSGRYKVVVHYFDAKGGASNAILRVGGDSDRFRFDDEKVWSTPSDRTETSRVSFDGVRIDKGEKIALKAMSHGEEQAAVDFIEFIPLGGDSSPGAPTAPKPAPAPAPAPAPNPKVSGGAFEREVLSLTNEAREKAGLSALRFDADLMQAAEGHSRDMAREKFFSHVGSDGDRLSDRTKDAGYKSAYVAENIAAGQDTPERVVDAWLDSPGHRANIMNPKFNEIGVGFVEDRNSPYDQYWTQVLGWDSSFA